MLSYAGHFEADGGSYDLVLPFRPDKLVLWNYTKFGTAAADPMSVWFRDFPDGDALQLQVVADNGSTGNTSSLLTTSNGFTANIGGDLDGTAFTAYSSGGQATLVGPELGVENVAGSFADRHATISGATQAKPVVITATAHGFGSAGDIKRVRITKVAGMVELNDNLYQATIIDANSFSLQQIPQPQSWSITLGSAVYGADSDEIYFEAYQFDQYVDLGDIA